MKGLPFVLGVAGHLDIVPAGRALVRRRIAETLQEIRRQAPHTPLVLLCSLADGADQLCADVALEHGCTLIAVLPAPAEQFRQEVADRARFDRLLSAAARVEIMDAPWPAYETTAAEIARRAHLLLLVWDGHEGDRVPPGGTAYSALLRRGEWNEGSLAWRVQRCGPARVIPAARQSRPPREHTRHENNGPEGWCLPELEGINRELAVAVGPAGTCLRASAENAAARLRKVVRWQAGLLSFAAATAFLLQLTGEYWSRPLLLWLAFASMFLLLVLGRFFALQRRSHDLNLNLRAVAEIMRISCAVPTALSPGEQGTALQQFQSFTWLIRTVLEWQRSGHGHPTRVEDWIGEQLAYFGRAKRRADAWQRRFARGSTAAYSLATLSTLLAALTVREFDHLGTWMLVISGFSIFAGAVLEQHEFLGAYAESSARYGGLRQLFRFASHATCEQAITPCVELEEELAREALAELGFWYATHKTRMPDAVQG